MSENKQLKGAWALWVGVVVMFLLVITAWTTLINIAKDNPVERIDTKASLNHNPTHNLNSQPTTSSSD